MAAFEGLLWSLVFLVIAVACLGRISGWVEMEKLAKRAAAAILGALFCLPLIAGQVRQAQNAVARAPSCDMPRVVVVGPDHLGAIVLVVVGHIALGIWFLRRRARGERRQRVLQQREADRRRERGRLPPRDFEGGAS